VKGNTFVKSSAQSYLTRPVVLCVIANSVVMRFVLFTSRANFLLSYLGHLTTEYLGMWHLALPSWSLYCKEDLRFY
jgi:hypothetical protein